MRKSVYKWSALCEIMTLYIVRCERYTKGKSFNFASTYTFLKGIMIYPLFIYYVRSQNQYGGRVEIFFFCNDILFQVDRHDMGG